MVFSIVRPDYTGVTGKDVATFTVLGSCIYEADTFALFLVKRYSGAASTIFWASSV